MKVAIITVLFPCPSETFILSQIIGLLDRGVDVHIFARDKVTDAELGSDLDKYNLAVRTTYYGSDLADIPRSKFLRIINLLRVFFKSNGAIKLALLKSLNFIKFGKKALSLQYFYTTQTFSKFGFSHFDVVHCQFGTLGKLAAVLKEVGIIQGRLITSFHGYDLSVYLNKAGADSYNQLFRCGDRFLPISNYWKQKLVSLGCPEDKIIVHRMGVDIKKILFQSRSQKHDGNIVRLISVGRMVEKKGMEFGIRAISKIYHLHPNLRYSIVGDGDLFEYLQSLSRNLGVDEIIDFLGWKKPEEIVDLMASSDIFLAPCVTAANGDQEGIPMVIMEAMALGLPVISTQHTGIPELVEHGATGYLVPERDVDALVNTIQILIENKQSWEKLAITSRKKIENQFNTESLNDQLLTLYQAAITR